MRTWVVLGCVVAIAGCGDDDGNGGGGDPDASGGAVDAASPDAGPDVVTVEVMDGVAPVELELAAYQDGDGPWQLLEGDGGAYSFPVASGRYALVTVCHGENDDILVETRRALVSETARVRHWCPRLLATANVALEVTGVEAAEDFQVGFSKFVYSFTGPQSTDILIVPATSDLVTIRTVADTSDLAVIERAVTLGDGDDVAIDLGDGAAMVTSDVTVEDALDGETPSTYTYFRPANGAGMATAAPAGSWAGVPGSLLEAGDLHHLTTVVGSLGTDDRRRVMTYVRQPDDVTVTLPPVSDAPAVEVVGVEPYGRIATTLPDDDGVQVYTLYFESTARYWYEDVTRGWLDAAGTDTIELAELSDLDGWDDAWGFAADAEVAWYSIAQTGNRSAGDVMDTLYMTLVPPLSGLDGLSVGEQWTSGDLVVE